jgi:thiol-disulfide isomerase/thioredoxin
MRSPLSIILIFSSLFSFGQAPFKTANTINNFTVKKILNNSSSSGSFNSLRKEITIIDFFGTWCIPCIKALPKLDSLRKKHASRLAVLLVSVEKEEQLNKFISSRKNLSFPVIVDDDDVITNLFQPPSFPYTVVINNNNKIIAITEASAITDEKINGWLAENDTYLVIHSQQSVEPVTNAQRMIKENKTTNSLNQLSQEFIYAAKTGNETSLILDRLKNINYDSLKEELATDEEKKAFWINLYNGFTQLFLKKDPDKYKNRNKFFKVKQIDIAGNQFSLDEIEHDILRRSKIKWSLGYLNKMFPGKTAKSLRVDKLDYRIHFALNCGAKSCPPIAFYEPSHLQTQLDVASRAYLTGEAVYNANKNTLTLPTIMSWFRHDFKGKKNMLKLIKKYDIVPQDKYPHISFKKYDWNLYLDNYKN